MPTLADDLRSWGGRVRAEGVRPRVGARLDELGCVLAIGDGVATIGGLAGARQDELLVLGGSVPAVAVALDRDEIGSILLGDWAGLKAGAPAARGGEVLRVPVGDGLIGRVVDPLGRPLDGGPEIEPAALWPIERPAPGILDRDLVATPLHTGITVIDAMIPVGLGQRELIIGDRKTGKTAIVVDAMLSQKAAGVICIYVAIGQATASVRRVIASLRKGSQRTIVVVAAPDGPPGLMWQAPYAAATMAEYFAERGGDVLVAYDDLTKHAAVHRQLSLLLRRPPGREAYPGDVFHLHAGLLERAAKLSPARGGGSVTALPIAETQAGNLSAYIPTNLISITDGQIFLESKLFWEGQRPAVNVGLSVSRVGGRTQAPALTRLAESLRLDYAQFLELEMFTRFGGMADERTRRTVEHGRRLRALLTQRPAAPLSLAEQVAGLLAVQRGLLDGVPVEAIEAFMGRLKGWLASEFPDLVRRLDEAGDLDEADWRLLEAKLPGLVPALARKD